MTSLRIPIYSTFIEVIFMTGADCERGVINILYNALTEAKKKGELKIKDEPLIVLEIPKDETKGDVATTVAMALTASEKKKPRDIAEIIVKTHQG